MTNLYGSFSLNPGTFGEMFFKERGLLYKAFKIKNINLAIESIRTLDIKGVGISQPYKIECIQYLDELDQHVKNIGACNTIINNGKLIGYNTDWLAIKEIVEQYDLPIVILGNGGYAKAAFYACRYLNRCYINITRQNWNINFQNHLIINCTPLILDISQNVLFNANINTITGQNLAFRQASHQYMLYMSN